MAPTAAICREALYEINLNSIEMFTPMSHHLGHGKATYRIN